MKQPSENTSNYLPIGKENMIGSFIINMGMFWVFLCRTAKIMKICNGFHFDNIVRSAG